MTSDEAFIEKVRSLSFSVRGGTPKFFQTREAAKSLFAKDDARHYIAKDKAMWDTIRNGNASDRALKKDVQAFEDAKYASKKERARKEKAERVKKLKSEYRKKYKCEA